jgi:hypothetical protein
MSNQYNHVGDFNEKISSERTAFGIITHIWQEEPDITAEDAALKLAPLIIGELDVKEPDVLHTILVYYCSNRLLALRRISRKPEEKLSAAKLQAKATEAWIAHLVLPTGKTILNSTFGDCAKGSGWLAKIAKKGRPNEIVGSKLSVKDLVQIWKSK